MGVLRGRLRTFYGGRYGRATAVLATTSAAAGALTGLVGVGLAGAPASHDTHSATTHITTAKPRHHARTASATPFSQVRPTRSHSPSPSPTATQTSVKPTPSASPTASSTPTAPPSNPPSSDPATAPPSASPPA